MYGRNSHQIRHYALVMLLFALTLRVPAIADAGESKPVQLNNANTVRQPRFLRASDASYQLKGFMKVYLHAITRDWLMKVPEENPILLDMFRDQDRMPYRKFSPHVGEFAGKYLTGAVGVLRLTGDKSLRAHLQKFVNRVVERQAENGYLGPYPKSYQFAGKALPNVVPDWYPWDAWGHYHMVVGLLSWSEYSGDQRALESAQRIGDLLCDTFLGQADKSMAGNNYRVNLSPIHGLCLLYKKTGNPRYLALAQQIVQQEFPQTVKLGQEDVSPDDAQRFERVRGNNYLVDAAAGKEYYQFPEPRWECLHTIMGLLELYWITGDEDCRRTMEQVWWSIVKLDRHNTGAFSSQEGAVGNPYDRRSIETCCVVAWTAASVEMLRLTGNSVVADELELTLLNAVLGYQSQTGKWATYSTPMDGVRTSCTVRPTFQTMEGGRYLHCCSTNSARGFGELSNWALMTDARGLVLNWYGPSVMSATVRGTPVSIEQQTDYPRSGRIKLTVTPEWPVEFELKLRIPYWSRRNQVEVNGEMAENVQSGRYFVLQRKWNSGDDITIHLDLSLHYWVGEKQCQGKTSIYRGPILLAYRHDSQEELPTLDAHQLDYQLLDSNNSDGIVVLECRTNDGKKIVLRDFDSAGEGGKQYVSWLNVVHVSPTPFSRENPLRSARSH